MITAELVKRLFRYDPETGLFYRLTTPQPIRWPIGSVVGSYNNLGYYVLHIEGKARLAHRIAWLYTYGKWPERHLDHINGNPSDCRLKNLRLAESCENHWNMKKFKNNTSGYRGVTFHRKTGKFAAEIWHKRKKYYIGLYKSKEEASIAYEALRSSLFGNFNRVL